MIERYFVAVDVTGIYEIKCKLTGKIYIGSSVNINRRWMNHKNLLKQNKHYNKYLQSSWNKYGEENFEWRVIEIVDKENLIESELKWFTNTDCHNPDLGFNLTAPVKGCFGYKPSNESRLKMSKSAKIAHSKRSKPLIEKSKIQNIIDLYKKGDTCNDISIKHNLSASTIYKILIENKVELRNKSEANKIVSDKVLIKLYNMGLSYSQIGMLLNINPSTISKRFGLLGFDSRCRSVAKLIKYSDAEFNRFFLNDEFLNKLLLIGN